MVRLRRIWLIHLRVTSTAPQFPWKPLRLALNMRFQLRVVKALGMDALKVSLDKMYKITYRVAIWEWYSYALDEGDEASQWFTNFFGKPCRLVRFDAGFSYILNLIALNPFEEFGLHREFSG